MSGIELPPVGEGDPVLSANDAQVLDLVLECADALLCPMWDHEEREGHLGAISVALSSKVLSPELHRLLSEAAAALKVHANASIIDLFGNKRDGAIELAQKLHALVPIEMRYLFHGTAFGRLAKISAEGLSPGHKTNWEGMVDEEHLQGAAFFDQTWRGAFDWAHTACMRMKGPKSSKGRQPAVLRIRRGELSVEPDLRAAKPGCFLVRGSVCTYDAEVLVGVQKGFPRWSPLREVTR